MDRLARKPRGRCVIVHSNRLIAEDLKQLLLAEGAHEVVISNRLADLSPGVDAVVFIEGDADAISNDPTVVAWLAFQTPVIAMNGSSDGNGPKPGIHRLEQPFRSEHVVALLRSLEVF